MKNEFELQLAPNPQPSRTSVFRRFMFCAAFTPRGPLITSLETPLADRQSSDF
jgi:hypothetical protein